eukprot:s1971_g18.t1
MLHCSTKSIMKCLRLRMICKLKHRWSSVWKNFFQKIQEIISKATSATCSVFDILHSLDDWQDHGTCDVYFAACGLVPTQRVCGHGNLRKTMQRSRQNILWLRKLSTRRKKDVKQVQSSAEQRLVQISTVEIWGCERSVSKKNI